MDATNCKAGRLAVRLGAIIPARFSIRLARIKLGSGLTLAGAGCLVELTTEAFIFGLQVVKPSL